RAPAPRVRDGDDRVRGRGRAPRFVGRRREDRAGRRAWMTAASGIVHEEFHGRDFAARGGTFEMVQLWVNLPKQDKSAPPRYQGITSAQIPVVELPEGRGTLRVIAGEFAGKRGPAKTFTKIEAYDLRLARAEKTDLTVPDGHTTAFVVL